MGEERERREERMKKVKEAGRKEVGRKRRTTIVKERKEEEIKRRNKGSGEETREECLGCSELFIYSSRCEVEWPSLESQNHIVTDSVTERLYLHSRANV